MNRSIASRNLICCAALILFAILSALASTNWFVDGVNGNDRCGQFLLGPAMNM